VLFEYKIVDVVNDGALPHTEADPLSQQYATQGDSVP
jgi:hypothetical protein